MDSGGPQDHSRASLDTAPHVHTAVVTACGGDPVAAAQVLAVLTEEQRHGIRVLPGALPERLQQAQRGPQALPEPWLRAQAPPESLPERPLPELQWRARQAQSRPAGRWPEPSSPERLP